MSKAILVIDTGDDPCWTCDLCVPLEDGNICGRLGAYITAIDRERECPLTQFPKREKDEGLYKISDTEAWAIRGYKKGWNACLDTLERKENE